MIAVHIFTRFFFFSIPVHRGMQLIHKLPVNADMYRRYPTVRRRGRTNGWTSTTRHHAACRVGRSDGFWVAEIGFGKPWRLHAHAGFLEASKQCSLSVTTRILSGHHIIIIPSPMVHEFGGDALASVDEAVQILTQTPLCSGGREFHNNLERGEVGLYAELLDRVKLHSVAFWLHPSGTMIRSA